nr:DUF2270 domain-containing protein [Devosia nitrariae]
MLGAPEPHQLTLPASPAERTNALIHYYRAEIGRMASWRDRIDRTSNWAITVVAALLSVSLSTPDSHHGVLLFAMLLVSLLLLVEARRYRFFDVYRARVRLMERQYFAQVLVPSQKPDLAWTRALAADLLAPRFLISLSSALTRRLRRNYIWMYLILLLAWVVKLTSVKLQAESPTDSRLQPLYRLLANAALGPVAGWVVVLTIVVFYLWLAYFTLRPRRRAGEMLHGDVHV